jgi:uncharacterized membrane protein YsdA (DUF1294 family)
MDLNAFATDTPLLLIGSIGLYLLIANLLSYLAFAIDKRRAARGEWRISEQTLLLLALLGGGIGAKLAQHRFRHKTRKQPFRTFLNMAVAVLPVAVLVLIVTEQAPRLRQVIADAGGALVMTPEDPALPAAFRPSGAGKWRSAPPKLQTP